MMVFYYSLDSREFRTADWYSEHLDKCFTKYVEEINFRSLFDVRVIF